jgi:predicted RNA-binding protein with PUA-like domain
MSKKREAKVDLSSADDNSGSKKVKRSKSTSSATAAPSNESTPVKRTKSASAAVGAVASETSTPFFLMKSEPEEFSIGDLSAMKNKISGWEGVRNGQARNILSSMKEGNHAFFYHSSDGKRTGIYGTMKIVREAYPDPTADTPSHKYYDPKNATATKKWVSVDVQLVDKWEKPLLLTTLKDHHSAPKSPLDNMLLFRNSRLSVQTVSPTEWEYIMSLKDSE